MLAHSAGGWLSRVHLLSKGTAGIDRLVTIGSPHSPPPQVCRDNMTVFFSWQKVHLADRWKRTLRLCQWSVKFCDSIVLTPGCTELLPC